jgi:putative addiction module antidote
VGVVEVRKVFRAGNSLVVSLPRDVVRGLGLEEGAPVAVEYDRDRRRVTIEPVRMAGRDSNSHDARVIEDFIDKYEDVLRGLGK